MNSVQELDDTVCSDFEHNIDGKIFNDCDADLKNCIESCIEYCKGTGLTSFVSG